MISNSEGSPPTLYVPESAVEDKIGALQIRGTDGALLQVRQRISLKGNNLQVKRKGIKQSVGQGWDGAGNFEGIYPCTAPQTPLTTQTGTLGPSTTSTFRGSTFFALRYRVNGVAGQQLSIWCRSSAFDSFLTLARSSNAIVSQSNSKGYLLNGDLTNAAINVTLPANDNYIIEVTTNLAGQQGDFYASWSSVAKESITLPNQPPVNCSDTGGMVIANYYLFISGQSASGGKVFVVDIRSNTVVQTITTPQMTGMLVYNAANNTIYAGSNQTSVTNGEVYPINASTFAVGTTIGPLGSRCRELSIDTVRNHLLVTNGSPSVAGYRATIIDCGTNTITTTFGPNGNDNVNFGVYSPANDQFYLNKFSGPVLRFSASALTLQQTISATGRGFMKFLRESNLIYVNEMNGDGQPQWQTLNPSTNLISAYPKIIWIMRDVVYSNCSNSIYLSGEDTGTMGGIIILNPATQAVRHFIRMDPNFALGERNLMLAYSQINSRVYALADSTTLSAIVSV